MLTSLMITIITAITSSLIGIFGVIRPTAELGAYALSLFNKMTEITFMGGNFIHFILGDGQAIIVPFVISLITIKYVLYPIIKLVTLILPIGN